MSYGRALSEMRRCMKPVWARRWGVPRDEEAHEVSQGPAEYISS